MRFWCASRAAFNDGGIFDEIWGRKSRVGSGEPHTDKTTGTP